jgi:hypothetical protein
MPENHFIAFQVFIEHNIDGSLLPILTEDHLTLRLGMKLGPALKLKSIVAKKVGSAHVQVCDHCSHCSKQQHSEAARDNLRQTEAKVTSERVRSPSPEVKQEADTLDDRVNTRSPNS